ncbi:hypothetical protein [Halovenus halobia]|uniref:hypothetical protein n=1 Tax=Halovenus halobia TaxID=3396622 RepID=UPI003F56FCF4
MSSLHFTPLEEAIYNIEQMFTPWNIQLELETDERIDRDRLDAAARRACEIHPLARAQMRDTNPLDTDYVWEIPETVEAVPIVECPASEAAEARRTHYSGRIDLRESPPFRLLVVRDRSGDTLCLATSHVPTDGVGALDLLGTLWQCYRGDQPADPPVGLADARELVEQRRPGGLGDRLRSLGAASSHLKSLFDPPTRIATETDDDRSGWGFVHRVLDPDTTEALLENRPAGASVNDVLVTAAHLAVERWNDDHGTSSGKISLLMPVNLRPKAWFYDVVGMYALFGSVGTRAAQRTQPARALETVREQTDKIRDRADALLESLALVPDATPVGLKRQSPTLLRGPGEALVDTVLLSNLGRIPEQRVGDDATVWFSPPSWQATPLSIGVVTVGTTVRFVVRHMYSALDNDAAARFAEQFEREIKRLV